MESFVLRTNTRDACLPVSQNDEVTVPNSGEVGRETAIDGVHIDQDMVPRE